MFRKILPIYWAFLTYMLLRPGDETKEHYWFIFLGFDKLVHLSVFAVLGFCFMVAWPKVKLTMFFQIILCYAFLTEILQDEMQLGRALEFNDVVADALGILLGHFIYKIAKKYFC